MHHIVLFDDDPERGALRRQHFDAHLAFLVENRKHLRDAGPLQRARAEVAHGGLWHVEGLNAEQISRLIAEDPLFAAGLRQNWQIQQWLPVFAAGLPTGNRP